MTRSILSAVAALVVCFSAAADDFHPISNAIKYKDTAGPAAKGRAGNASIEARALLNKDESTDIEVTTGSFDAGTTAGSLERVQVKLGGVEDALNYSGTGGGTFTTQLPNLLRYQPVDVTAHVTGVDGARMDVVTASDRVRLRPNLTFTWIRAQQHGMIGVPISVSVDIMETNGDMGARTDCVLRAGGIEVDRARNIWVDAGGMVTCSMAAALHTAGRHYLTVTLESVRPADYDPADNRIDAFTQIHDYDEELNEWTAMASDENFHYRSQSYSPWDSYLNDNQGWVSSYSISAYQREVLDMAQLRFSYHAESDGQAIADVVDAPFIGYRHDPYDMSCGRATIGHVTAQACVMRWGPGSSQPPFSQYSVAGNGGDVTYYSEIWSRWYNPETATYEYYTYNSTWRNVYGYQQPIGSTVSQDFSVTDGTRTLWARPFLNLVPYEYNYGYEACYGDYCDSFSAHRVGKSGFARGGLGF